MVCKGDTTEFCGGSSRLSVWTLAPLASSSSATTSSTTAASAPTSTSSRPTISGGTYLGCISETNPRALNADSNSANTQTLEICAQRARDKNYRYFGLEYSSECWLDDVINSASQTVDDTKCKMPCSGNASQKCGGASVLSLFNNTAYTPRIPVIVSLPNNKTFVYQGCYADQGNPRTLSGYSTSQNTNTVATCAQLCLSKGFSFAGVEYGAECYCSNTGPGSGVAVKADSQCSKACAGNARQNCGGSMALQVYRLGGSS